MADPTKYTLTYDFSGYQASNPSDPLPGLNVDVQFENVATSIGEIVDAIMDVRRSDGALKNEIVTLESLSEAVRTQFQGASGEDGAAATVTVGTVSTGDPGTNASVSNSGTENAAVLDFTIPRGNPGLDGDGTGDMVAATYDPQAIAGDAFDVDNHTDGTTNKVFSATEQTKLAGVADGATANASDATLLARANHTGTQAIATVSGLQSALDAKQAGNANLTEIAAMTLGAVGKTVLEDASAADIRGTAQAAAKTQTFAISGIVVAPVNGDYRLVVKAPFAGTIIETTTRSIVGTCTATFKINNTPLGGAVNAASPTEQSQAHASANAFVAGDDIVMGLSAVSSITYLSFTIVYTRVMA